MAAEESTVPPGTVPRAATDVYAARRELRETSLRETRKLRAATEREADELLAGARREAEAKRFPRLA
jgi:regulator of protease activity HflC (stomatin/prohibitin superfamily)